MDDLRKKANERDAVYNKNKELVTKSYSIQSALESKEKRINELKQQNEEFREEIRKLSKDGVHPVLNNAIKP
jgi:cell division protein FtsL